MRLLKGELVFKNKSDKQEHTAVDDQIAEVLALMKTEDAQSEQYSALLTTLERLHKLKLSSEPEKKSVSPDAIVAASASIAGIVLILGFEKANVLTSKAMSFVFKPKS